MDRAEPIGVQGTFRLWRAVGSGKQSPLRDAGCKPLHEAVEREVAAAVQFVARQDIQREVVVEHAALGIERQSRKRGVVQAAGQLLERSTMHVVFPCSSIFAAPDSPLDERRLNERRLNERRLNERRLNERRLDERRLDERRLDTWFAEPRPPRISGAPPISGSCCPTSGAALPISGAPFGEMGP